MSGAQSSASSMFRVERLSARTIRLLTFSSQGFIELISYFFYCMFPLPFRTADFILANSIDSFRAVSWITPLYMVILSRLSSMQALLFINAEITASALSFLPRRLIKSLRQSQTEIISLLCTKGVFSGREGGDRGAGGNPLNLLWPMVSSLRSFSFEFWRLSFYN